MPTEPIEKKADVGATAEAAQTAAQQLPRPQLVALVGQLMARNGVAAMALVQRRAADGDGFSVRGIKMNSSVLREALAKLDPSAKEQLANHLNQAAAKKAQTPEKVSRATSRWSLEAGSVWCRDYDSPASEMVAAFDMDGTLINPRSGKEFGCTADDWCWWNEAVPDKLRKLASAGFKIALISNQSGLSKGKLEPRTVHDLIDAVQASLGVPLVALVAAKDDTFRKPRVGMWRLLETELSGGKAPKLSASLFVGDAAGRTQTETAKKDFADSDLKFALNVGVRFQTPEEFFLGADDRPVPTSFNFDPRDLSGSLAEPAGLRPPAGRANACEVLLLVGPPCSGKSTLAK